MSEKRRIQDLTHTRERLDGDVSSPTPLTDAANEAGDCPEQPGLCDEGRPEPAYLGLPCGTSSSACSATANNEECQKTAPAETTAQGVPPLCAVWPSCRRSLGVHRWRSRAARGGRHTEVRCCLQTLWGQLRWLNRQACVHCGTVRSHRCRRCNSCGFDAPLRELRVGDTFQDRRQPGHQDAAASASRVPNCPIRDVVLTESGEAAAPSSAGPRQLHSLGAWSPRHATAWAERLEGATSGHQFGVLLCRYRCRLLLAEIPRGVDRNSELKQRLQLWQPGQVSVLICKVLGQQNSGSLRTAGKTQPQTDEQRGTRACALTARGSVSKSMKGLVGSAAQGSADCRRNWTTALILRSWGHWNSSHQYGVHRGGANRLGWRAIQTSAERNLGARTQ